MMRGKRGIPCPHRDHTRARTRRRRRSSRFFESSSASPPSTRSWGPSRPPFPAPPHPPHPPPGKSLSASHHAPRTKDSSVFPKDKGYGQEMSRRALFCPDPVTMVIGAAYCPPLRPHTHTHVPEIGIGGQQRLPAPRAHDVHLRRRRRHPLPRQGVYVGVCARSRTRVRPGCMSSSVKSLSPPLLVASHLAHNRTMYRPRKKACAHARTYTQNPESWGTFFQALFTLYEVTRARARLPALVLTEESFTATTTRQTSFDSPTPPRGRQGRSHTGRVRPTNAHIAQVSVRAPT